jgi:hypothetical protein
MGRIQSSTRALAVVLAGLVMFLPACTHRSTVQIGSHKVTLSRHGFQKRLFVDDKAAVPGFEYEGVAADGRGLKVAIRGDRVKVNDEPSGRLRPGDAVLITDDGVLINSLDYGESEKYLRANNPSAEPSID